MGLSVFSSRKREILVKGYTVIELFFDHMRSLHPESCFTGSD